MIAVKICWNTYPDGSPVDVLKVDWDHRNAPVSYYGPFDSLDEAEDWMNNDYPDGDTDVFEMEADDYDLDKRVFVNTPESIHGDIPDEDIREITEEQIHDRGDLY